MAQAGLVHSVIPDLSDLSLWSAVIRGVYRCKPFQCIMLTARHQMRFSLLAPL